jgi:alkylation response protein AidB-like acyl-CoA dehydrogenase
MDLSYSDEQKQIKEGVERFVREQYAFETRRKIAATDRGWLPENWAKFAELGWLGMSFSEADGGFGGSMVDTAILMEAFGSGLVLEPYLPTVVLGGGLLAAGGSAAQKEALLAPMIGGETQLPGSRSRRATTSLTWP